jgi:Tfp pilus assembly protein PilO
VKRSASLSPKATILVAAAALSLMIAMGGYLLAVSPQRSRASDLEGQIDSTRQQIDQRRAASRVPQVPIRFAELFALAKAMPDEEDVPGVLLELSRLADETGMTITSVVPRARAAGSDGYSRLPLEVVVEGDFYDLSDFLYRLRTLVSVRDGKLEASGRLFAVDAVVVAEGSSSFPQLQATLTLSAFAYDGAPADGVAPASSGTPTPASEGAATASGATD